MVVFGSVIFSVVLVFICYSIFQFKRRADMIKRKAPGPYEDTVGPILFAILLMIAIIAQFLLKLQSYELLTKLVQVVGVLDDEGTNTTI